MQLLEWLFNGKDSSQNCSAFTRSLMLSIVINIGSQMLSIWAYKGLYYVEISILVGTAFFGLPLRYYLEKRYIFAFTSQNLAHDGRLFIFYSAMGIITTLLFWGTEYTFHLVYNTDEMRYVGGIIGLAFGFYVKYRLDKFVFVANFSEVSR